jgi:hypothetical protein
MQCGNGNFINEPLIFQGYYIPGPICPNTPGFYPTWFGTFPQEPPISSEEPVPPPGEKEKYDSIPQEYRESGAFREMLRDRLYLEQQQEKQESS